jgi:hypothetical protein
MRVAFYVGAILLFVFVGVSMLRAAIYQHKLYRYLLMNHSEKWKELTTVWGVGPGMANSLRGMKFLFGPDYLNDPEVLRLKALVKNSFAWVIFSWLAGFFWVFVYAIIAAWR